MDLSLIVAAYDMDRELPRTVETLCPRYQRSIDHLTYEILVVDNGSPRPVREDTLQRIAPNLRVIRVDNAPPSPAAAINAAVQSSGGSVVGLFIDGARMASPGLIAAAMMGHAAGPDRVIGSLAFHLGPDVQMRSVFEGYDQAAEDALLAGIPWQSDGYTLFSRSVLAGSSAAGWFGTIAESNAVFMDRALWQTLGGLDERFATPGGGFVNLDFWDRAVALSGRSPWMILGEGTFHQVHGGAATNGPPAAREAMAAEYQSIMGRPFEAPRYQPRFIGTLDGDLAARFGGAEPPRQRVAGSVAGRAFAVGLPARALTAVQAGTLRLRYRGRRLAKNPFDLAIYLQVLERLRPRTIIEIGTSEGGSALWLRDQCRSLGLDCRILSLDIAPPGGPVDGVAFLAADAARPDETFPHAHIARAAHPWLVIEDSAHTYDCTSAVLRYFDPLLHAGDYMVVEDGVVADLPEPHYRRYADGPNRAVRDFIAARPGAYRIDTEACDLFGHNVTWCPNGWLVRQET